MSRLKTETSLEKEKKNPHTQNESTACLGTNRWVKSKELSK